jgi:hypothetical protein
MTLADILQRRFAKYGDDTGKPPPPPEIDIFLFAQAQELSPRRIPPKLKWTSI